MFKRKSKHFFENIGSISEKYSQYRKIQDKPNDQTSYEHIICNSVTLNRVKDIIIR